MRKKPIPNPIARPTLARPLSPARPRAVLPTVAALLAMAAIGCDQETAIKRDESSVAVGHTLASNVSHVSIVSNESNESVVKVPRIHDPSEPLPALGIIEQPPPPPPPPAPPPVPTTHPYPVKGGMKAVHPPPPPMPPTAAGGLKAIHPPIPPVKKPVKLGGDVAPAYPEST